MIQLDHSISKNHIIFKSKINNVDRFYTKNLQGDTILNVFNRDLMNIFLNQFEETIGEITYDDIVHISVIENRDEIIQNLPVNLVGLYVTSSICTNIILSESVQNSIKSIDIDKTNINVLPDLSGCRNLTRIRISTSNIRNFNINYELPNTLTDINLQKNVIQNTNTNFSHDKLHKIASAHFNKINFSDNHLIYDLIPDNIARKSHVIRQGVYEHQPVRNNNVAEVHIRNLIRQRDLEPSAPPAPQDIFNSQSVYLTSINKSVVASIHVIREYLKNNGVNVRQLTPNIDDSTSSVLSSVAKYITRHNKITVDEEYQLKFNNFLRRYNFNNEEFIISFKLETKHGITKLTYKETFELVWATIIHMIGTNQYEEADLFERLHTEIRDSIGMCYTGKYNRIINTLVGILDGVNVGISEKEEIELEFDKLLTRLRKCINFETFNTAYCEANEILYNSSDKHSWLIALNDYAPNPIMIPTSKIVPTSLDVDKKYFITWDNLILDEEDNVVGTMIYDTIAEIQ
jgi:hypothetical protein